MTIENLEIKNALNNQTLKARPVQVHFIWPKRVNTQNSCQKRVSVACYTGTSPEHFQQT